MNAKALERLAAAEKHLDTAVLACPDEKDRPTVKAIGAVLLNLVGACLEQSAANHELNVLVPGISTIEPRGDATALIAAVESLLDSATGDNCPVCAATPGTQHSDRCRDLRSALKRAKGGTA